MRAVISKSGRERRSLPQSPRRLSIETYFAMRNQCNRHSSKWTLFKLPQVPSWLSTTEGIIENRYSSWLSRSILWKMQKTKMWCMKLSLLRLYSLSTQPGNRRKDWALLIFLSVRFLMYFSRSFLNRSMSADDISGRVGLVLCGPPNIPKRTEGQDSAKYVRPWIGYMQDLVVTLTQVIVLGAQGGYILFCTTV